MPSFKIANSSTAPTLWLISYFSGTNLVNEVTTSESLATNWGSAANRDAVITLINSNPDNAPNFIGHVPPVKH